MAGAGPVLTLRHVLSPAAFGAVLQGSLFGLVGLLPQKYSAIFMSGQGLAGTFAALAMLLAIGSKPDSLLLSNTCLSRDHHPVAQVTRTLRQRPWATSSHRAWGRWSRWSATCCCLTWSVGARRCPRLHMACSQ